MRKYIKRQERDREIVSITRETFSELVNIALATARIEELIAEEKKGNFKLRPNMNIFIYGLPSSTKSTILKEIQRKTNTGQYFTDLTFPALVGNIDSQTRQINLGASWECKNSFMYLDEFNLRQRNKDTIHALLQLIEGGEYSRKIAAFAAPINKVEGDLYFIFKDGTFKIRTRFSLILATMIFPYNSQSMEVRALVSRCVTIPLNLSKQELIDIANGYSIYTYEDLTPKQKKIIVKKKDYEKILNYVERETDTEGTNFLRIVGDCVRVYAILKKHRYDLYEIIAKLGSKKFAEYMLGDED